MTSLQWQDADDQPPAPERATLNPWLGVAAALTGFIIGYTLRLFF